MTMRHEFVTEEDLKMKKVARVLVPLALCFWLNASGALAKGCKDEPTPTVNIKLENNTFSYPNKDDLSTPSASICRGQPFNVSVEFKDDTIEKMVLRKFRPTVTRKGKWEKLSNPAWASKQMTFECPSPPCEGAGAITMSETLPSSWHGNWLGVKTRIIVMTVDLYLRDGPMVTIDPPWGERP